MRAGWWRIKWKSLLACVLTGMVVFATSFLYYEFGHKAGCQSVSGSNSVKMVEQFRAGKATFCDLDEIARLYACPALRWTVPFPKGIALAYICDFAGKNGFVVFFDTPVELRNQTTMELLKTGIRVKPHCSGNHQGKNYEILQLQKGPWKTASC